MDLCSLGLCPITLLGIGAVPSLCFLIFSALSLRNSNRLTSNFIHSTVNLRLVLWRVRCAGTTGCDESVEEKGSLGIATAMGEGALQGSGGNVQLTGGDFLVGWCRKPIPGGEHPPHGSNFLCGIFLVKHKSKRQIAPGGAAPCWEPLFLGLVCSQGDRGASPGDP